jgi:hypothetical protein
MKPYETKVGDHKLVLSVPSTVEEFDTLAKKQGACLEAATDYEVYHGTLGEARNKFAELVEKKHNIKRRDIGTGVFEGEGEERKEVTKEEKFDVYLERVAAELGLEGDTPFQHIADSMSAGGENEVKFDPSVKPRQPGAGLKLPKYATEGAARFFDKTPHPKSGKVQNVEVFGRAYKKLVGEDLPELPIDREAYIKVLGACIVKYNNSTELPG